MYRLEIIAERAGLEPFIWRFFPALVPTMQSEHFVVYACSFSEQLDETRKHLLDNWQEEDIIVAYKILENDAPMLKSHLTPVEAAEMTGYSEEHWRQLAWRGKIPGAMKKGKQWLLPRAIVEEQLVHGPYRVKSVGDDGGVYEVVKMVDNHSTTWEELHPRSMTHSQQVAQRKCARLNRRWQVDVCQGEPELIQTRLKYWREATN
jgi:excisionase family DNA binding protein